MDTQQILYKILMIPAILIAFTFHEYAHAIVADRLGDKTPRFQGRLTLNPIAHIDPIGFILILLTGFGWAKPVETNPSSYKNYYRDDLKISFAGPFANLIIGFVFAIFTVLFWKLSPVQGTVFTIIIEILKMTVSINCMLFFLNLVPVPGFDGYHIVRDLFPKFFYNMSDTFTRYQFLIFLVLILPILPGNQSVFTYIVQVPANWVYNIFMNIATMLQ
ncbi:site-2 protease family protein [Clostridium estertheticum]|nr:site-2 protease family protein [Clostridium estertheticum]MCB2305054.1 site-2 protease family protein [Clostridium estertheticum]MCB2343676.1 site-2 protease family protein [Clostridium estertheticum]MCB2348595.1 site-2 protease family protein [Clostridium estertheticum]WAG47538.1 site-2 protease family protein [Clostridium estertheticum]